MAVQTKTSDTRLKVKKAKPAKEKKAPDASMSDDRMKSHAQHQDRGMGSSFAYAVANIMDEAKGLKGSQNGFLGEASEVLDPKQFAHSLVKDKK